ncbi:MAG: alpha/beta fold hydrolase [Candidatus Dormibacteria bacterium]
MSSPLEERFATINGGRMRYLIGGQGKPLVLCHGFVSSGEEFGGRFAALTSQRTIIAPDLPGNGQSAPLRGRRHTSDAMADGVQELLTHLGVGEFDLGGLCLGAPVACAIARGNEKAVGRLILHTPLISPNMLRRSVRWQIRTYTSPPLWSAIYWLSRRRVVSDLWKRLAVEGDDVDRATKDINFRNQQRAHPDAAREWLRDALDRSDVGVLARRTLPTLIIVPQEDRLVDVARLREVAAGLRNVDLFVDKNGGHGWGPEAVARHLTVIQRALAEEDETPATSGGCEVPV